jgi:hypothetical protein
MPQPPLLYQEGSYFTSSRVRYVDALSEEGSFSERISN